MSEEPEEMKEAQQMIAEITQLVERLTDITVMSRRANRKAVDIIHTMLHTPNVFTELPEQLKEDVANWSKVCLAVEAETEILLAMCDDDEEE
tara:strand:- start:656 stop:931 length:276 start_codon:yes stop_codon:yes gene_type:complete